MDKEILELLKSIQGDIALMKDDITSMKSDITSMKGDIKRLDNKIDNLDNKVDKRFDELTSDIGNLVSKDIAEGISSQIKDVKQDVEFLTYKTTETEKDVYKIQSHLKIIK
ncbi:MAG: hypothetical protein PUD42_04125 [Clostridiales bacterium]|nr:hypothetical protein [Clostridiales bacterium]NLK23305.1 hypothetical protein [Clostridiales bacterium]